MMTEPKKRHSNVALFVPHAGCPHQCSFCNQRHIAGTQSMPTVQDVITACENALKTRRTCAEESEIAFFGGSFTAIAQETMVDLLKAAYPYVENGSFGGIRLSTRPDAINEDILLLLRDYGVTTIELGAQSMDDRVLLQNGRGHTAKDVQAAAKLIKVHGFSLGLQMMTGLPGDSDDGAINTARQLADLQPDCVRIYPTLVIENTPLARWYRRGEYQPQTVEEAVELCSRLLSFFEEERHIPVIRLGLHNETDMQGHCLAGPFHPAFRERCESLLWLQRIRAVLRERQRGMVRIGVSPSQLSKAIGQKRENVDKLRAEGYVAVIKADPDLNEKDLRVEVIE